MASTLLRLLLAATCLASLGACTFYVGGSDAGTRDGEKAARATAATPARSA